MQPTSPHGSATSAEPRDTTESRRPKTWLWITLTSVFGVTTLVMSGLFVWQLLREEALPVPPVPDEIAQCQIDAERLEKENEDLKADLKKAESKADEAADAVSLDDLPVVVYERAGLTDETVMDDFENKLVAPLSDYAREQGQTVLTINIEIPENEGEEYIYTAVYAEGSTEAALFGVRGQALPWWTPSCLERCKFSDAFEQKYPEVIDALENGQ